MISGLAVAESDAAVQQWLTVWTAHLSGQSDDDDAQRLLTTMDSIAASAKSSRVIAACYLMAGVGQPFALTAAEVLAPTAPEQLQALRAQSTSFLVTDGPAPPLRLADLDICTVPIPVGAFASLASRQRAVDLLQTLRVENRDGAGGDGDEVLAARCIAVARLWGELPQNNPMADRLVAHGVFALLLDTTGTGTSTASLTSAALAALLPLALQLADRPALADQVLGLALLWALLAAGRAPTSLLLATGPWLLPALHRLAETVPAAFTVTDKDADEGGNSAGAAALLMCRLHQVVAVACLASPGGAGHHHAHLLLQRAVQRVGTSLDPAAAWPTLLALRPFVAGGCPAGVLRCQAQPLAEALLALANRWHAPATLLCFQLLSALCWRCFRAGDSDDDDSGSGAHRALAAIVLTEVARVRLFLAAGQADLTGATAVADAPVVRALQVELDAITKQTEPF